MKKISIIMAVLLVFSTVAFATNKVEEEEPIIDEDKDETPPEDTEADLSKDKEDEYNNTQEEEKPLTSEPDEPKEEIKEEVKDEVEKLPKTGQKSDIIFYILGLSLILMGIKKIRR